MLVFPDDIKKALIEIARSTRVYLEGNILKLIDPGVDPEFRKYHEEAVLGDKSARQRRLAITKQIQHQNRELINQNEKNEQLNNELKLAFAEQQKAKEQLIATVEKIEKQNKDLYIHNEEEVKVPIIKN